MYLKSGMNPTIVQLGELPDPANKAENRGDPLASERQATEPATPAGPTRFLLSEFEKAHA